MVGLQDYTVSQFRALKIWSITAAKPVAIRSVCARENTSLSMQVHTNPMADRSIDFRKSDMIMNKRFYPRPRTKEHRQNTQFLLKKKYSILEEAQQSTPSRSIHLVCSHKENNLAWEQLHKKLLLSAQFIRCERVQKPFRGFGLNYVGNHKQN
jgi:hypothetical protein